MAKLGGLPPCGFAVLADKGGQPPLLVERRAKGKRVTVISGVRGNARALCTALTTLLGVGGTVHAKGNLADVEVQGEQVERVAQALTQLGCLRGPTGAKAPAPATVVERSCGYDAFLKEEGGRKERKERHRTGAALEPAEPPEDAPCRAWHGYWIYCSGHCDRAPSSFDVWDLESLDPFVECDRFVVTGSARAAGGAKILSGLQRLGMAAEVGVAVLSYREELAQDAARRVAPKASFCAQAVSAELQERELLVCSTCGASFTMRRTLQLHMRQHQREVPEAWTETGPQALASDDWRRDSYIDKAREEVDFVTAKVQPEDLLNKEDWDSPEAAQYVVSSERGSKYTLGSLLDAAVPIASRRRKKAPELRGDCPLCGQSFLQSVLEEHVDQCLRAAPPEAGATSAEASEVPELPTELLESLLQLDLPEAAAEFFWCIYEHHVQSKSVHEAFLAALEEALAWVPEPEEAESSEGPEMEACPVCGDRFRLEVIQQHVEDCLMAVEPLAAPPVPTAPPAPAAPVAPALAAVPAKVPKPPEEKKVPKAPEAPEVPEVPEARGRWAKAKAPPETAQERIARLKAEAKQAKDAAKQRTDGENIAVLKGGSGSLEAHMQPARRFWRRLLPPVAEATSLGPGREQLLTLAQAYRWFSQVPAAQRRMKKAKLAMRNVIADKILEHWPALASDREQLKWHLHELFSHAMTVQESRELTSQLMTFWDRFMEEQGPEATATRLRLTQQAAYRLEVPLNTAVDVLQTAEDGMKRVRLLLRDADEKEAWVLPEDLQVQFFKGAPTGERQV
ncbi:unnamed protein product [Symbiodinium natans]|uniref:C2H2-type domain-containing protein n=1 Tax=Symbiodinium natans TaxID=878477 RepID=A0A812H119_9DINO|nr:unnamed protein product [Symbiodinium natans]